MENYRKNSNSKNIYEYFIIIGLSNKSIDSISEPEIYLSPKYLFHYPKSNNIEDLYKQYEFYRNCCYKNGVKVNRIEIFNNNEYEKYLLESNIYSSPIETFTFFKTSENVKDSKYIYGMKFKDIYIIKQEKSIILYIYEKTYLFISDKSQLLQLFENSCLKILYEKKLNFLNKISQYTNIFEKNKFNSFLYFNEEKYNKDITTFLEQIYLTNNPKIIINNINNSTNKILDINETFIDWLIRKIIYYYDNISFFKILVMILFEQQIIFYGNDLELVTFSCFLFANIIAPFEWVFSIIPNLPLNNLNFLSSPLPFIIGLICNRNDITESLINKNQCNLIYLEKNKILINYDINESFEYGIIINKFKENVFELFKEIGDKKSLSDEEIRRQSKNFYLGFKKLISEYMLSNYLKIVEGIKNERYRSKEFKMNVNKVIKDKNDKIFFNNFSETQMFVNKFLTKAED